MSNNITIEEALKNKNAIFIDVRSPAEYEEDAIPFSHNVPLLDNIQRAQVGLCYKEKGSKKARLLGIKLVSALLPYKIDAIQQVAKNKEIVLYCWRGGMRSKAMAELLNLAGIPSFRLTGGYKSFRKYVNHFFNDSFNYRFIVLYGLTGVGKSEIIDKLRENNIPILDLEKIAMHRGSVFGGVGLDKQPSQKKFESTIFAELNKYQQEQTIIVEGESRRIGKLIIPEQCFLSMQKGKGVLVYNSISSRVNRIMAEYTRGINNNIQELEISIQQLERRIGKSKVQYLINLLHTEKFEDVIEELLVGYYDVLYHHPTEPSNKYDFCVNAENINEAVLELVNYVKELSSSKGGSNNGKDRGSP
jgi:tRNA 2-selenouridine synthase